MTSVLNCTATDSVTAGNNRYGIDDIVGSGFYSEELTAQGESFDHPTAYELVDCTAE